MPKQTTSKGCNTSDNNLAKNIVLSDEEKMALGEALAKFVQICKSIKQKEEEQ